MKPALLLLCLLFGLNIFAQEYNADWDKVFEYETKGQTRSADAVAEGILQKAKKDGNEPQLLKAFFFKSRYLQTLDADAQVKILQLLKTSIKTASVPGAAFMESLYAEMLDNLYNSNRYAINQRATTPKLPDDLYEWSAQNYKDEIEAAYRRSLKNREILYKTPLRRYDAILDVNPLTPDTKRSLYDFLVQRYLNSPGAFDPYGNLGPTPETFGRLMGETPDFNNVKTDSLTPDIKKRILLLQDTEKFYTAKNDAYSLQRTILLRIDYFLYHSYNVAPDVKDSIYSQALQHFATRWGKSNFGYQAKFRLASFYKDRANLKTQPGYMQKALDLCNEIIENAGLTDIAPDTQLLKNGMINKQAAITLQDYVLPGKPMLALVKYKNLDAVTLSYYKIGIKQGGKNFLDSIVKVRKPMFEKIIVLPKRDDHFEHSTEVILPQLEQGEYIVAAHDVTTGENIYGLTVINVASTVLLEQDAANATHYQVLERETGAPIQDVPVKVGDKKMHTDSNGRFVAIAEKPPVAKKNADQKTKDKIKEKVKKIKPSLPVEVIYKGDTLYNSFYNRYSAADEPYEEEDEDFPAWAQLFLDRAIYRPGQTVYFKGIIMQFPKGKYSPAAGVFTSIKVTDANGNNFKSFRLQANEFGSFAGEFVLPANGLTGNFRITADEDDDPESDPLYSNRKEEHPFWDYADFERGYLSFSVEEYKRPTYNVTFKPVTDDVHLNENVTLTGTAKSYSGAPVSGAKVTYHVRRKASMTRFYETDSGSINITDGEAVTDADGNFKITFKAAPDDKSNPKGLPIFTYTAYTTVTDGSGETHDGTGSVRVGYHSLEVEASIPELVNPKNKNSITLNSHNLNAQFMPCQGEVAIYKIKDDNRVLKSRPWEAPEIQTISPEDFEKNFPYIPYRDIVKDSVILGQKVFYQKVNTLNDKEIALTDFSGWEAGAYQLIFTAKDSANNTVSNKMKFTFKRDTDVMARRLVYESTGGKTGKNGYYEITLSTSLPLLYVNVSSDDGRQTLSRTIKITDGKTTVKLPRSPGTDFTKVFIDYLWQNELFSNQYREEGDNGLAGLTIATQTMSDKLQPGSNETWSFTVSGDKGAAEVLASMYDASLDDFATERWRFSLPGDNYHDYDYNLEQWETDDTGDSQLRFDNYSTLKNNTLYHYEQQLNTFGFNINKSVNNYALKNKKTDVKVSDNGKPAPEGTFLLTGIVIDEAGMEIPGVTVTIKGTDTSVSTDFDGNYQINVSKNDIITFSFIGMISQEITITGTILNTKMYEDVSRLEEVVIVGYGTTKRMNVTASISTITSKTIEGRPNSNFIQTLQGQVAGINITTASGEPGANGTVILRGSGSVNGAAQPLYVIDGVPLTEEQFLELDPNDISQMTILKDAGATAIYGSRGANGVILINTKQGEKEMQALQQVQARKNFKETAFFFPQLKTDANGSVHFSFTTPEALTEWKLRLLAHNKNGMGGYFEKKLVSQKDLMVVPNMPRFLREGDTITLSAKITNLTGEAKTGTALLQLFDAMTMKPIDAVMGNDVAARAFSTGAKANTTVSWTITIPQGIEGVQYKILAKAGNFTDGEENILPVLANKMLVTESIPLWVKPHTVKQYTFEGLKNNKSATLQQQGITLEYTSNPAWTALQSLPYLMEYEHECAEQVFSRLYANAIASHIVKSNPKIAVLFASWHKDGKPVSKMEQNAELKNIIMAETPWMLDNQSKEEQDNRMALLFDLDKMSSALSANFDKLAKKQSVTGGFPWFEGGDENEYITRHILSGLGHLSKLGIALPQPEKVKQLLQKGIIFTDNQFIKIYKIKRGNEKKNKATAITYNDLHYLYMRSFYLEQFPIGDSLKTAIKPYLSKVKDGWTDYSLYEKGLAALVLSRFGEAETAKEIILSIKENAVLNEENGMYWLENKAGWYWYRAPIETQAIIIEAFTEVTNDAQSVDAMKVWLLKQKQNKNWPTTKSTTEAVYALLMQGGDWLSVKDLTTFTLGDKKLLDAKISESGKEAETGYLKLQWKPDEVSNSLSTLTIDNQSDVPGYGGFYWQYFEQLDKVKPAQDGLMDIRKELYIKANSGSTVALKPITAQSPLKIGDLVTVRLVLNIKESVEFVHLKDMRAAGFEPVDVLSGQKYRDKLRYYQSTHDAATHFFFDHIEKGTYVIEYEVRANNSGTFSNGITTIQSMYAPEFSGHTGGIRVHVE